MSTLVDHEKSDAYYKQVRNIKVDKIGEYIYRLQWSKHRSSYHVISSTEKLMKYPLVKQQVFWGGDLPLYAT